MSALKVNMIEEKSKIPIRYLLEKNLLLGYTLNYGGGCDGDLQKFLRGEGCLISKVREGSDFDAMLYQCERGGFDTVICLYVMDSLASHNREKALLDAQKYVKEGGRLHVVVRRDLESASDLKGNLYNVKLSKPFKSILKRSGEFEIYTWSPS